jgi:hypothetical protein
VCTSGTRASPIACASAVPAVSEPSVPTRIEANAYSRAYASFVIAITIPAATNTTITI